MSENGNGKLAARARQEPMCPIDPNVRPAECNAVHSELASIKYTQEAHGRMLRKFGNSLRGITEKLGRIEAAHGIAPGKRSRR